MKCETYNLEDKKKGSIAVSDDVFALAWNNDLVHQSMTAHLENTRQKIAHTKGTGDVRGGGKKPWRQKGTGRARHGTIRSPLWRGGGITFGPTLEKVFGKKINKRMKVKALFTVLSKKLEDGEVIFVDTLALKEAKTKEAKTLMDNLSGYVENVMEKKVLFVPASENKDFQKAVRNIKNASAVRPESLNVYDLLKNKYVVFDIASVEEMEKHFK